MVLHALYFVPQVRRAVSTYIPASTPYEMADVLMDPEQGLIPPSDGPGMFPCTLTEPLSHLSHPEKGRMVWALLETFVYMELARMTELSADQLLETLAVEPWTRPHEGPGNLAYGEYRHHSLQLFGDGLHRIL